MLIPFVQSPSWNWTDLGCLGETGQRVLRYKKTIFINILLTLLFIYNKRFTIKLLLFPHFEIVFTFLGNKNL